MQFSRAYLQQIAPFVPKDVPVISTSKVRGGWRKIATDRHPRTHLTLDNHHCSHVGCAASVQGIEKGTLAMMDSILLETLGARELAFLSGPSFAREIMLEQCTCVVVASDSEALANEVCDLMSTHYVRVFTSGDVLGVEVSLLGLAWHDLTADHQSAARPARPTNPLPDRALIRWAELSRTSSPLLPACAKAWASG